MNAEQASIHAFPSGDKIAPPFCKDCKWCDRKFPYARCSAPQNIDSFISLVTGEPERKFRDEFCSVGRKYDLEDTCGESGRWFEPRE